MPLLTPEEIESAAQQLYQMRKQQRLIEEGVRLLEAAESTSPEALAKKARLEQLFVSAGLSEEEAKAINAVDETDDDKIIMALEAISVKGQGK